MNEPISTANVHRLVSLMQDAGDDGSHTHQADGQYDGPDAQPCTHPGCRCLVRWLPDGDRHAWRAVATRRKAEAQPQQRQGDITVDETLCDDGDRHSATSIADYHADQIIARHENMDQALRYARRCALYYGGAYWLAIVENIWGRYADPRFAGAIYG
jgi:hypothetical protein